MKLDKQNLEALLLDYAEQIKVLISPEIWSNVLLDCSKNEILILFLLYRNTDVNMSQIAEYINVPLNTATGVVSRMEKKNMLLRERSPEDKRVVTICMTEHGKLLMKNILAQFMHYGQKLLTVLSPEEVELAGTVLDKVIQILKEEQNSTPIIKKVKQITIE